MIILMLVVKDEIRSKGNVELKNSGGNRYHLSATGNIHYKRRSWLLVPTVMMPKKSKIFLALGMLKEIEGNYHQ